MVVPWANVPPQSADKIAEIITQKQFSKPTDFLAFLNHMNLPICQIKANTDDYAIIIGKLNYYLRHCIQK